MQTEEVQANRNDPAKVERVGAQEGLARPATERRDRLPAEDGQHAPREQAGGERDPQEERLDVLPPALPLPDDVDDIQERERRDDRRLPFDRQVIAKASVKSSTRRVRSAQRATSNVGAK